MTRVSNVVISTEVSSVGIYHSTDRSCGINVGRNPLVTTANKSFWQLRPQLPRYCCTYDVKIILRLIKNRGKNDTLSLRQLFFKIVFLVALSTLSRYYRSNRATQPHELDSMDHKPFYLNPQNEESDGLGCRGHGWSGQSHGQSY